MKTIVTAAVLALAGLAGASGADAQDYRNHGPRQGQPRVEQHRRHRSFPAPHRTRIWVPARYETRFAGYDNCGRPIHRSVCVTAGHWSFAAERCD